MLIDIFDAFLFGDGAVDGFVAVDGRTVEDGGDDFSIREFKEPRDDVVIVQSELVFVWDVFVELVG